MRDLSLSLAKLEDFYGAIVLREENGVHLNHYRQLVVYYEGREEISYFIKKPNHQQYRSIFLINVVQYYSFRPQRFGSYLANFKLLRVLALENTKCISDSVSGTLSGNNVGRVLGSLVYLRYLSLRGSDLKTFLWIHKLVLLQTLNLNIKSLSIPSNVLRKLAHLRHLYLPARYAKKNFKLQFKGLSKLEILENFDTAWCEFKDLPKLSSLRRLTLKAASGYDDVKQMFNYLSGLALSSNSCLEYLALDIRIWFHPGLLNDPDMIRQLLCNNKFKIYELSILGQLPGLSEMFILNHTDRIDISQSRITILKLNAAWQEEDPMPVLEKIPTLRDLDLESGTYMGKEMACSATGFPRLTRLLIGLLPYLKKWRVEEGSMPVLQHLEIDCCFELEELPEGFIYLTSLRELVLTKMRKLYNRVGVVNGEHGPDFYKVAHVPRLIINRAMYE